MYELIHRSGSRRYMHQAAAMKLAIAVILGAAASADAQAPEDKCAEKRLKATGVYSKCLTVTEKDQLARRGSCSLTSSTQCYLDGNCPMGESCAKDTTKYDKNTATCVLKFDRIWNAKSPCFAEPTYANAKSKVETDVAAITTGVLTGSPVTAATCALPATGQTTAFGAGSDGAIQAGCARSFTDNGDGTITDNCTDLMWEKKDDSGGLHDVDNTYTWSGASNGSTNIMDGTIQDFIDQLNDVAGGGASCFAGYCDWRVPNRNELATLVDNELPAGPTINTAFNQCPAACSDVTDPACSCTSSSAYWSATTYAPGPSLAWGVVFVNGGTDYYIKGNGTHVRAVRSGS